MTLTFALTALLAAMAAVTMLNLAAAPRLHRYPTKATGPVVSVLIPARDEAENLSRSLPALMRSAYGPLEVIVLDDGSTDATTAVARGIAALDPRVRVLQGTEPPRGWTGKNWACHQLAREADGDILLFCDADVVPGPDALGRTAAALEAEGADVLTAFPRHRYGTAAERAVVPVVAQLPIAALLPLPLVHRTRAISVSAGNGQWMAWRRAAYYRVGGHAAVAGDVLEDVRLARRAKAAGLRLLPVLAPRELEVRMYRGWHEVRNGFAKNLYPLVGGSPLYAALVPVVFGLAMLLPLALPLAAGFVGSPIAPALAPLALLIVIRVAGATLFGAGGDTILLHAAGVPAAVALVLESAARHRGGRVSWKRRILAREGG